jgi:peptide/nickel transport system substrate-binding protein
MKKLTSLIVLVVTIALVSCGKKDEAGSNKYGLSTKNNVVWWLSGDMTQLVPYLAHDAYAQYVYPYIWEPLNLVQPRTQELLPWLASTAEISPDHLTYTFTMNPKATWSDGKPVTGEDVVFSFKCVMNPKQIETTQSRSNFNALDSISFVGGDKMKVAFHLHEPYFMMDRVLAGGYIPILPKHVFDPNNLTDQMSWSDIKNPNSKNPILLQQSTEFNDPGKIRDPKYMVGSGPYLFEEWKTNSHVSLKKNPNYWAKDMPWGETYVDQIIFKTINDNSAAVTAMKAKELDFMDRVPAAQWSTIDSVKNPYIRKDTVYFNNRSYVEWNGERPIFKSKKTRWALSHLINRDVIIRDIFKGMALPVNSSVNFTQPFYDASLPNIDFSIEKAKALLTEDGWSDTDGDGILDKVIDGKKTPFKFTFSIYTGSDVIKNTALVIAEQMRKAGIQAEVNTTEWSVWINNNRLHNYDAAIANIAGNATEDDPYQLWHSSQAKNKGQNVYSFINAEADQIMEQYRLEFDPAKRAELSKRLQRIIYDEMPITPLFCTPLRIAITDRFDNVEFIRQRPCVEPRWWVVRGSGITAKQGAPSTLKPAAVTQ